MSRTKVEGVDTVVRNLNRMVRQVKGKTSAGLFAAGLAVQRNAQERVPVEQGNLKGSAYTERRGDTEVEVGFTAEYSLFVHENMEQVLKGQPRRSGIGFYWGPAGEPKFLEKALKDVDVVGIVAKYAKEGVR